MYTIFYHLLDRPFTALPDPFFLWLGPKYAEALSGLRRGILENQGLALLTGDAGCGKTTLLNALTRGLDKTVRWAVVGDPGLERLDFYNAIANGFGLDREFTSKVQFLLQFTAVLHKAHDEGQRVVLLIDDCHRLSQDMLEELRLLANIEKEGARLINILLAGRRDFLDMLMQPNNRAIRQRLTLHVELVPFSLDETDEYIRHRLKVAGSQEELFTARAVAVIHHAAQGIPRFINMICDQALHVGAAAENRLIDDRLVEECLGQLKLPPGRQRDDDCAKRKPTRPARGIAALLARIAAGAATAGRLILPGNQLSRWVKYALGAALIVGAGLAFLFHSINDREVAQGGRPAVQQPAGREKARDVDSPVVGEVGKLEPIGKAINLNLVPEREKMLARKGSEAEESRQGSPPEEKKEVSPVAPKRDEEQTAEARVPEVATGEPESSGAATSAAVPQAPEPAPSVEAAGKKAGEPPAEPRPEPAKPSAAASVPPRKVVLPLRPNSLELTDEAANDYRQFIEALKSHPKSKLLVKGFVSAKSNSPENVRLSEERALGVQKLLVKSGIDPARITVKGMGNQEPLAPNDTSEGRTKNRRVEIEVVGR